MRIVINEKYGSFDVSEEALDLLDKCGIKTTNYRASEYRANPTFISVVECLGERVNTSFSKLKVVEIPEGFTDYDILEYDGVERIIAVYDGKIKYIK